MHSIALRGRLLVLVAAGIMPLAAISGIALWALDEDRRRALAAGFDLYLVKPVAEDELEKLLAER